MRKAASPSDDQGKALAGAKPLEVSWVLSDEWTTNQRLELENDLIAAHVLELGVVPPAQFSG